MYILGFAILCIYGVFRAYLDSMHVNHVEDIQQQLREINDSLYSIKMRQRNEKDDSMRK